jgi:hypothetical protein
MTLPYKTTHYPWLIFLLISIAVFHTATLRQGHIWADDFAMYIHHGQNIVDGRPYVQTGYLFTPTAPVSPRMYPPVFPLLLAPVVRFSGLNLIPMKFEQVTFFVLALAVICLYWRRDIGRKYTSRWQPYSASGHTSGPPKTMYSPTCLSYSSSLSLP